MSWIDELKVGDRVVISRGYTAVGELSRVTRLTETQVICGNERFRKRDGYAPGSSGYDRTRLTEPTTKAVEAAEGRQLRLRIQRAVQDKTVTLASLRNMAAAIDKDSTND